MRTRSVIVRSQPGEYEVADVDLDEPWQDEIMVRMVAAGMCHSDDHVVTGDVPVSTLPMAIGHEGAGVVERVGPHTVGWEVGDHVVFSFLPSCGRCRWCARGMQNLCDSGAKTLQGSRPAGASSFRMQLPDGTPVGQASGISTFSEYTTVSTRSAIKIDEDLPLDRMCLLGCGVGTGWGSAVNSAGAGPGQTVIIMGVGGVGINAVQGAAHAGASNVVAVDPVEFKRETALELGATRAFSSMEQATEYVKSRTNGQGADSAIVAVGVTRPAHVGEAFAAVRKGGVVVVTGLGDLTEVGIPVSLGELTLYQKRLQGSLFGASNPTSDILVQTQMYRDGKLDLDSLVTNTYRLDEVAQGYADMHAGKNIRGVIRFD